MQTTTNTTKQATNVKLNTATKEDLIGQGTTLTPKLGDTVLFHRNDPHGSDTLLSYPAIIVAIDTQTHAATLQVFLESHLAPFNKVPFSGHTKVAGGYTLRD